MMYAMLELGDNHYVALTDEVGIHGMGGVVVEVLHDNELDVFSVKDVILNGRYLQSTRHLVEEWAQNPSRTMEELELADRFLNGDRPIGAIQYDYATDTCRDSAGREVDVKKGEWVLK